MREAKRNVTTADSKFLRVARTPLQLDFISSLSSFFYEKKFPLHFPYERTETNPQPLRALLRAYYVVWYIKKIAHTSFVYARAIYDSITRNSSYTLGVPP